MESENINKRLETKKGFSERTYARLRRRRKEKTHLDVLLPDPPFLFSYHFLSLSRGHSIIVSVATLTPVLLYRKTPPGHFVQ